ncbi:MAG: YchJ family protein, partial [Myxococcota bacterium]
MTPCPCGSGMALAKCCQPYIDGDAIPKTAEALMRSRYTAYAIGDTSYVIATHDPETRGDLDEDAVRQWSEEAVWLGLEILGTEKGGERDDVGVVEFVCAYEERGKARRHRERSDFRRRDGRWYFRDGEVEGQEPEVRAAPKVGRNDPCPCGSGKKYKKCHGA